MKLDYLKRSPFWVLLGSPFILWFLLKLGNNGVPLLTSDSGAYLLNARELKVPFDRTIFYSLLMRVFMEMESVGFGVALFNTLLLPFVLFNYLYFGLNRIVVFKLSRFILLLVYVLALIFTPLPWIFIQIMPDVYTPILGLSLLHFLMATNTKQAWLYGCISVFSAIMHNGNLILISVFALLLLGMFLLKKYSNFAVIKRLFFVVFGGWASVIGSNLIVGHGFTASKASHIFLIAKFAESGLLKNYLDENCQSKPNSLCLYKDDLPEHAWDFIWPEQGILSKTGGWHNSKEEYSRIINGIVTDPYFLVQLMFKSVEATYLQCLVYGAGDGLSKLDEKSTVYTEVVNHHTFYQSKINNCFQQKESIAFSEFNLFYRCCILLAIIIVGFILIKRFRTRKTSTLLVFAFTFTICNAFATGAFANVIMRLNTRGVIVFEIVLFLILIQTLMESTFINKICSRFKIGISSNLRSELYILFSFLI